MSVLNRPYIIFLFFTILLFASSAILSQTYQRIINYPPITGPEVAYLNSSSGGFNNIEHQFIDIDNDGDYDLFFLNSDGTFGWFENTGDIFQAVLELSTDSIPGLYLSDWFFFLDLDNDSDFDILTGNSEYVRLIRNIGDSYSPFFIIDQDTLRDDNGNPIISEFGSNPSLTDIDNDGDYDFISGNSAGTVTFYENIGSPENFSLRFITNFWQNILIIGEGDENRHGSSSFDFSDIDSDGDQDLIWGDFFSKSLYLIENQGSPSLPSMQLISNIYPINLDSVFTSGYNMPRFVDIDGDGLKDLFVSVLYDPTVPQSLMYYKNQGSPQSPDHRKITEDFIQTLDVGNNSHPVFSDIDADGDLDLFIGALKNPNGSIYFFENTGSPTDPFYEFRTDTFAGIITDLSAIPFFADIDGDEDADLFVGKFDGRISYYRNDGTKFSAIFNYAGDIRDSNQNLIDIGSSASPFLIDIDDDGDFDLVIGAFNGRFFLYKNNGSNSDFSFALEDNYFFDLDVGDNSTPFLIDYTEDSKLELFSGNRSGNIFQYVNNGTSEQPEWFLENDHFLDQNFGGYSVPCFVDIDNDSDTDLLFGNVKGGLYFYRNLSVSNLIIDAESKPEKFSLIQAFPNPFNPNINIRINLKAEGRISLKIFNLLGEEVKEIFNGYLNSGTHQFGWDVTNDSYVSLPAGHYFILLITDETYSSTKITYLK